MSIPPATVPVPATALTDELLARWRTGPNRVEKIAAEQLPRCYQVTDRLPAYRAVRAVYDAAHTAGDLLLRTLMERSVNQMRQQREQFPAQVAATLTAAALEVESFSYLPHETLVRVADRDRALFVHPVPGFRYAYVNPCTPTHWQATDLLGTAAQTIADAGWECELTEDGRCVTVLPSITDPILTAQTRTRA